MRHVLFPWLFTNFEAFSLKMILSVYAHLLASLVYMGSEDVLKLFG